MRHRKQRNDGQVQYFRGARGSRLDEQGASLREPAPEGRSEPRTAGRLLHAWHHTAAALRGAFSTCGVAFSATATMPARIIIAPTTHRPVFSEPVRSVSQPVM